MLRRQVDYLRWPTDHRSRKAFLALLMRGSALAKGYGTFGIQCSGDWRAASSTGILPVGKPGILPGLPPQARFAKPGRMPGLPTAGTGCATTS